MKRRTIVRIVIWAVVLLALVALTHFIILPLFDTSGEGEGHDVEVYGYEETDAEWKLENENLLLTMDPATTHFTVTDKRTGKVWASSPEQADKDPLALPVEKNKLLSAFTLTYSTKAGMKTTFSSNEFSVQNGVYALEMVEDGIRVNYSVGKIKRTFVIPPAITDERMQVFLEKMTSKQKKDVKEYYREYNIDKLRKTDNKDELLQMYPDLAEQHVWVLRDTTKDYLREKLQDYFEAAGYTKEDLELDQSRINVTTTNTAAIFNVSMVYRLEGNDLVVELPLDAIDFNVDYPLTSLTVLPAFGAGSTQDKGFLLVPDGAGAIINFNNGKVSQRSYYADLYGWDWGSIRKQVSNETRNNFPVFGLSTEQGSFICLLEEGAAWAGVNADISGRYTSYNTVNASYTIIHGDAYDVSERTNNAVYMFEQQVPQGAIRQRYRFLTENGYMDMADAYRDYLQAKYPEMNRETSGKTPVMVEMVGAIDKVQQRFGVPTNVPIAMTTYKQAAELLQKLVAADVGDLSVRYAGWMNGGLNQKILNKVKLVKELGSEADLKALTKAAKDANVPLYLDGLTQYARDSGLMQGFISFRDAARFTTREEAELPEYSSIWYGSPSWRETYYLIKPTLAMQAADILSQSAADYGATGVSFRDLGSMLSADYDGKDLTTRVQAQAQQVEKLKELRAKGQNVMIRQGNDYAAVYADMVTDMDFDGSQYGIIDAYVPFYPMALHGTVPYTGEAINLADDGEELILRSAEMGAGLQLSLMANGVRDLQDTWFSAYYGADAAFLDEWMDVIREYDAQMSGTFNQRMTGHVRQGNVAVTSYENGTRVYVNFGYEAETLDGVEVPARSYTVVKEAVQ